MWVLPLKGVLNGMYPIFQRLQADPGHWNCLEEIDPYCLGKWNRIFAKSGLKADSDWLFIRSEGRVDHEHERVIGLFRELIGQSPYPMSKTHLFILTDETGRALDFIGESGVIGLLGECNVGAGTSFAIQHAGINAISVALELETPVIIQGDQHHLKLFSTWTCMACPIRRGDDIIGYLDLSFASETEISFATLWLEHLVKLMEARLGNKDKEHFYERLGRYGLSPREKEIAYRWVQNQSTVRMATDLNICEGTVRNYIKKVYEKVGVHSRVALIKKFT